MFIFVEKNRSRVWENIKIVPQIILTSVIYIIIAFVFMASSTIWSVDFSCS